MCYEQLEEQENLELLNSQEIRRKEEMEVKRWQELSSIELSKIINHIL